MICAVCGHDRAEHKTDASDYRHGSWCAVCNRDEMNGPCSDLFLPTHEFLPSSPEHRGPHGTLRPTDCRICGLDQDTEGYHI